MASIGTRTNACTFSSAVTGMTRVFLTNAKKEILCIRYMVNYKIIGTKLCSKRDLSEVNKVVTTGMSGCC